MHLVGGLPGGGGGHPPCLRVVDKPPVSHGDHVHPVERRDRVEEAGEHVGGGDVGPGVL